MPLTGASRVRIFDPTGETVRRHGPAEGRDRPQGPAADQEAERIGTELARIRPQRQPRLREHQPRRPSRIEEARTLEEEIADRAAGRERLFRALRRQRRARPVADRADQGGGHRGRRAHHRDQRCGADHRGGTCGAGAADRCRRSCRDHYCDAADTGHRPAAAEPGDRIRTRAHRRDRDDSTSAACTTARTRSATSPAPWRR